MMSRSALRQASRQLRAISASGRIAAVSFFSLPLRGCELPERLSSRQMVSEKACRARLGGSETSLKLK